MEKLHERMYQFDQLLLLQMPQLHRHLEAQGVLPSMYASQWFMTFFAYRCPLDLVFRVFDLVFVDGAHIVLNFALALMKKNQQTILSLEFEALLEFFSGEIFNAYKVNFNQYDIKMYIILYIYLIIGSPLFITNRMMRMALYKTHVTLMFHLDY
jgi:hypothetical protein